MGQIKKPKPAKLIVGFIFRDELTLCKAERLLERKFGKIDFESQVLAFGHTDYYEAEFGKDLLRKFISFKKLAPPQNLSKIKIATNLIERKLSSGTRRINIDPGYLDMAKLVLATTKDYKHRIYIGRGIYAEVTLRYENKAFKPWEWSYPDYKSDEYIAIFNRIRQIYGQQIKEETQNSERKTKN